MPADATPVGRRAVLAGLGAAAVVAGLGLGACGAGDDDEEDDAVAPQVISYGPHPLQRGALTRPAGTEPVPVVVLVHGGFWRPQYDRTLMDPLAEAVVAAGWAAWNLDYRPLGPDGGWPTTFTDVAAGVDHVAELADPHGLDPARVATVGHSAGGTLALWASARHTLPEGAPGADPVVRPAATVSLAGMTSLVSAWIDRLGTGVVEELMGGPPEGDREQDYFLASPSDRLPLGVPQLLVHGEDDPIVPARQSSAHAARARDEGDDATARVLAGVDHLDVIDPGTESWAGVEGWLEDHLP